MNQNQIITFIKAIDENYFDSFIKEGQICMNTLKWFREFESTDSNIGDKYEGAVFACGYGFKIEYADIGKENCKTLGMGENLRVTYSENDANIFCLYKYTLNQKSISKGNFLVPKNYIDMFSHHRFVIFRNPEEFIYRMKNAILKLGKKYEHGMVKYYKLDEKPQTKLTNFHKPDRFSYQNEFRILFKDENAERKILKIGSLEDICFEIVFNR